MSEPIPENYTRFDTMREHILARPSMYISSPQCTPRDIYTINEQGYFEPERVMVPPAMERLYIEILSNASDNILRTHMYNSNPTHKVKVSPGAIHVLMNEDTISITNNGLPIPVEVHPTFGIYVPELIFGCLMSSSNYTNTRFGAGVNGLGAKLTNIFSEYFRVEVYDHFRHLSYVQEWYNSMEEKSEPLIGQYNGALSQVSITYKLNFKLFGLPKYDEVCLRLFSFYAAQVAFSSNVKVLFNDVEFAFEDIVAFGMRFLPPVHSEGPSGGSMPLHYHHKETFAGKDMGKKGPQEDAEIDLLLVDTPGRGRSLTLINSMLTYDDKNMNNDVYKAFSDVLKESIFNTSKRKFNFTIADIKRHTTLVISYRIPNPDFEGQTKGKAINLPKITLDPAIGKIFKNWQLVERLYLDQQNRDLKKLSKTDGKKVRHLMTKAEEANFAGSEKSYLCTLILVEGDSAMGYAVKLVEQFPHGREYFGIYPMRGKPINAMKASPLHLAENKEWTEVKRLLGLKEDTDYRRGENFKTLRYGGVIILTDADNDGKHIMGLILSFFYWRFSTLLDIGYIKYLRTPILRLTRSIRGKVESVKFYTQQEYEEWCQTNDPKKWEHKYHKGLGSSKDSDIKDDYRTKRIITCYYDPESPANFDLVFGKYGSNSRKIWLTDKTPPFESFWEGPPNGRERILYQPISHFLYYEMRAFLNTSIIRAIPSFIDGLKDAQRKILWGTMLQWGSKKGWRLKEAKPIKVERFAAFVAQQSSYHHGEKCLCDAITHMAQDFVGANNVPYLLPEGQLGTRNMRGKDAAAPRYTFVLPSPLLPYLFRNEDMSLLMHVEDEGSTYEPVFFLPVIPTVLLNGCEGIGVAYRTFVPPYNIRDICQWYLERLEWDKTGVPREMPILMPYYRGFKGTIEIKESKNNIHKVTLPENADGKEGNENIEDTENTEPSEGTPDVDNTASFRDFIEPSGEGGVENAGLCQNGLLEATQNTLGGFNLVTTGVFSILGNVITIQEIPVNVSIHGYDMWLKTMREKGTLRSYKNLSGSNSVHFQIMGFQEPPTTKSLHLVSIRSLGCMVLLDESFTPITFARVEDILETFYAYRLPFYQRRKDNILQDHESRLKELQERRKVIEAIVKGEIDVLGRDKKKVQGELNRLGVDPGILSKINIRQCTWEEIVALGEEIGTLEREVEVIKGMDVRDLWQRDIRELLREMDKLGGL